MEVILSAIYGLENVLIYSTSTRCEMMVLCPYSRQRPREKKNM